MAKTKLQELADHLKAADDLVIELGKDKEHGRSPILAAIRSCTNTGLERIENHATWLVANPAPKPAAAAEPAKA